MIQQETEVSQNIGDVESVPWNTHLLGFSIMLVLVSSVAWSLISQLDVVSIASGSIIPASKVQKVQHLEGGIIEKINVREGDLVEEGQALITLSAKNSETDMQELSLRIYSLQADVLRLEAESKNQKDLTFSADFEKEHANLVKQSLDLFKARRDNLKNNLALKKSEMQVFSNEISEINIRLKNNRERLKLVQEQVKIGENLLKNNLSNRYEQIERLKEVNSLRSYINEDKAAIKRSKTSLVTAKAQLEQVQKIYNENVQKELSESKNNLEEFRTRVVRFEDSIERTVLRAPVSGTVKALYVTTEGGVTRGGETLLEIVPGNDLLIVEAQLPPQEIGHVEIGQSAFVQLQASDAQQLGKINGTVAHISPDSLISPDGIAYYVVHINVEKNYFGEEDDQVKLFPGMIVSTGIILGKRSVLGYIFSPFTKNAAFIFTEQ